MLSQSQSLPHSENRITRTVIAAALSSLGQDVAISGSVPGLRCRATQRVDAATGEEGGRGFQAEPGLQAWMRKCAFKPGLLPSAPTPRPRVGEAGMSINSSLAGCMVDTVG